MKITLVSPEFPFSGRVPLVPPILEYLSALTLREAPETDIRLIDANQVPIAPSEVEGDAIAISVMTATAPWAYRFADGCRKAGKQVVLGGIHPTALPQEAAQHADAVVVGEAESVWGRALADLRKGTLEKFYRGERMPLDNLPRPVDGKLKGNYRFRAFFTMRGCPHRCTFCSVRKFFGDTIRYRPVGEFVNEIEACAGKLWFNGDDNIWGGNVERSIDLFRALAGGTKRHWYGFGDLRSIQGRNGREMLAAARASGLFSVWSGWESDEANLGVFKARGKQGTDRVGAIKQMQDAGIDVVLFVVLGGRQDSIDSFKRTLEMSERLQVGIHPVLLTPLPGTELYDEYREHLLPEMGWEFFTGVRAVFEHPSPEMSPLRREEEYHQLCNELFRFERIVRRIGSISARGFPATHLYSLMMQLPMKHALSKAYGEWKAGVDCDGGLPGKNPASVADPNICAHAIVKDQTGPGTGTDPVPSPCGFWWWAAIIGGITIVDLFEYSYFGFSVHLNRIEIAFFVVSFLALLAVPFIDRKRWYRYVDVLFDWTQEGHARRTLILRRMAFGGLCFLGQYWAFLCAFEH